MKCGLRFAVDADLEQSNVIDPPRVCKNEQALHIDDISTDSGG